ncbi:MAG: hypothetical protein LBO63_01950 [Oscillospiraceae bacterium]|jgi:hypothetical protein|nr:hypothetical protein [Oscillospiraceae bacterium]
MAIKKLEALQIEEDGNVRVFHQGDSISVDYKHEWTGEPQHVEGVVAKSDARDELRLNTKDTPSMSISVRFDKIIKVN